MLFKPDQDPELQPRTSRTLLISIALHLVLVAIFAMNPEFLRSTPKRIIRIAGQDYDLSKTQLTELTMPPSPAQPKPPPDVAENRPLVQPPQPRIEQPPPPRPQPPPVTISPEDVIAEGARPDAPPRPSRGDTSEMARSGSPEPRQPSRPEAATPQRPAENTRGQLAQNTNPNALQLPNLLDSAGRIVDNSMEEARRRYSQGGRTGLPHAQENPNFSTEEPTILSDTRGYDFGPYMNQVINRVRINWYSLIPEIARAPFMRRGRVVIVFTILQTGAVHDLRVVANSGADPLDRAAWGAIAASNPFPQLPSNFDGDHLVLQFTFLYNMSR